MRKLETMLWTVLADVCEDRLGLAQAVEKFCADPNLREAVFLDLTEMVARDQQRNEFLSERRAAGLKLDPATAEVTWDYAQILDPYGLGDLEPEADCIGRVMFARVPDSDLWISQYELPEATCDALRARMVNEPDAIGYRGMTNPGTESEDQ